jgi:hypothetical protein
MSALNVDVLTISHLEKQGCKRALLDRKFPELYPESINRLAKSIHNDESLSGIDIDNFCKLCLREQIWGTLASTTTMFVYFGYDYYMYIDSSDRSEAVVDRLNITGLFVEAFESPYLLLRSLSH